MYVRAYTHKCNIHIHMYRLFYLCIYCMSIIDVIEEWIFLCHYSLDMAQWVVRYPLASHMAIGNYHFHRFLKGPKYGYVEMGGFPCPSYVGYRRTRVSPLHMLIKIVHTSQPKIHGDLRCETMIKSRNNGWCGLILKNILQRRLVCDHETTALKQEHLPFK